MAKRRLADEYDAAQERGEVVGAHNGAKNRVLSENAIATAADIGLSRKDIHEARQIRDAEADDPGIVRRTLDALLEVGGLQRDTFPIMAKSGFMQHALAGGDFDDGGSVHYR